MNFLQRLNHAMDTNRSLLCVGLDSRADRVQERYGLDQADFNRRIVEATADLVCAYKPNLAFYESQGVAGLRALEETLKHIPGDVITIADAKRGDIGSTAEQYAEAWLRRFGFDAITINPYMGRDAIQPFAQDPAKGVFALCLTSNPSANDLEYHGDPPLFEYVAGFLSQWNEQENLGCVVGATRPEALARVRELVGPVMPFLVPGVGAQGGSVEDVVQHGCGPDGRGLVINASRSVLFAGDGPDWIEASRREAATLRDTINQARAGLSTRPVQ